MRASVFFKIATVSCILVSQLFDASAYAQEGAPAGAAGGAAGAAAAGAPAAAASGAAQGAGPASPGAPQARGARANARSASPGATTGVAAGASAGASSVAPVGVKAGAPGAPSLGSATKGGATAKTAAEIRAGAPPAASSAPAQQFSISPPVSYSPGAAPSAGLLGPTVTGYGGNYNINNAFMPSYSQMMPPTMNQPIPTFGASNFAAPQPSVGGMITNCLQGLASNLDGYAQMSALQATVDAADEKMGFQPYPGVRRRSNPRYYRSVVNGLSDQVAGCQQFINDKMEIGHWGRVALEEMKKHEDIYKFKVPGDISSFCPNFSAKNEDTRLRFWIWFFASVAAPESSCNPGIVGRGPNGNAIGLFQLEPAACAKVNMYYSEHDLQRAEPNIRCAVALFARELRNRPTIMIGTSRGELGTYWGTLRNDNYNAARGADITAHLRTEARLRQNPECRGVSH